MPHLRAFGVNDAFRMLVEEFGEYVLGDSPISSGNIQLTRTSSRNGPVVQALEPVILTYLEPRQRVLFNQARDANPFFHMMEALWMLQGRNDLAPLQYYVSTFGQFSDDGKTLNGAYGYRWRNGRGYWGTWQKGITHNKDQDGRFDQLAVIINHLKSKPDSRRCVLQMWNTGDDLQAIDDSKDVCCNLNCKFQINNGRLDMTVDNRSNDLVLGMLGANVVHFSFLLEYMAACIGVEMGVYNQITNNLHVYTNSFEPIKWLEDKTENFYQRVPRINVVKLVKNPEQFDKELKTFNEEWIGEQDLHEDWNARFSEPFFELVAKHVARVFYFHKQRNYVKALQWCNEIAADDWRIACTNWVRKREARYNKASDDGVSHEDNRNPYLENHLRREAKDASTN